jgi:hypothetical protein
MPQYVDHLKSHIANQIGLFNCSACGGVCRNPEHLKALIKSGSREPSRVQNNPAAAVVVAQQDHVACEPDVSRMLSVELVEENGKTSSESRKQPKYFI